jgi:hypothetical protein
MRDWRGLARRIRPTNSFKSTLVFRLLQALRQVDAAELVHDVHQAVPSRLHLLKSPFFKTPDNHVPIQTNIMSVIAESSSQ